MKTLSCPKCNRVQSSGKFCLDDGSQLIEKVTLGIKFMPIRNVARTVDQLKRDVRNWLSRIGVKNEDIKITTNERDGTASIEYLLLGKRYNFESHRQRNVTYNMAAIEQFLHFRVLSIEHGIETAEQAFGSYAAIEGTVPYEFQTESQLRDALKRFHPDTGNGNTVEFMKVKAELDRRA